MRKSLKNAFKGVVGELIGTHAPRDPLGIYEYEKEHKKKKYQVLKRFGIYKSDANNDTFKSPAVSSLSEEYYRKFYMEVVKFPNSYLYYNPEKPLALFNGETRDFTEVNPEDIILTDAGDVSSKTMNSINTLKSEVNSKEQQSDLKVALEEIMKHNEKLARNTIEAIKSYCIPIQDMIEKLYAENDSLKELIQTGLTQQPQVHDEIAEFFEELDDSDPLKAFRN